MSDGSVSIDGNDYDTYGDLDDATIYWRPSKVIREQGAAWFAATSDNQAGALVLATQLIDTLPFLVQYGTHELRTAFDDFDTIAYELAGQLLLDPAILTSLSTGSNVKRVDAGGGVGVEFFNETVSTTGRFSPLVVALLDRYLDDGALTATQSSWASGTGDCPSPSGDSWRWGLTRTS